MKSFQSAVAMYRLNAKELPPPSIGFRALVERPASLAPDARWIQIMSKVPLDPWENSYGYIVGNGFEDGYGIYSLGPDGKSATQGNDPDDINSWREENLANNPPNKVPTWTLWTCASAGIVGFSLGRRSGKSAANCSVGL